MLQYSVVDKMKWIILQSLVVSAVLAGSVLSSEPRKRYDKFSVLRAYPESVTALEYLKSLESQLPGSEFWKLPRRLGHPADLMLVSDAMREEAVAKLTGAKIRYEVMIDNLQDLIDQERAEMDRGAAASAGRNGKALNLESFNGFDEIMSWLDDLAEQYPDLASVESVGDTYEGRTMKLIKIGTGDENPAVWMDGGIHAREWLSPATVIWFINKLLTQYDTSSAIKELVDSVTWYILPVHNPDGYEYSRSRERLWRKNRSPTDSWSIFWGTCYGVDPNRNWDNNWGTSGISHSGCSDIYCGKSPASEKCVQNVADYILTKKADIKLYLSFHTYSQMWLLPYSYGYNRVPNYQELYALAGEAVTALGDVYGTRYTYGQVPDLLYTASGGSMDWAYDTAEIRHSFGVELRDTGRYGFVAPAAEIRPTGEETWAAVESLVNNIIMSGK